MSIETAYLAIRLQGPLQAWGFESQYNRRNTGLMPTKSAIMGMCLAALGVDRGSELEKKWLDEAVKFQLLTLAIPRTIQRYGDKKSMLPVRRITDYHTVQNTKTADGKIKDTHLTYRQYLCDAEFACVLSGSSESIRLLANALENPVWGLWLGRKACIPTAPVFAGLYAAREEALNALLDGRTEDEFTRQFDVARFEDGSDSLPDQALCFAAPDGIRKFAPRRVKFKDAKV